MSTTRDWEAAITHVEKEKSDCHIVRLKDWSCRWIQRKVKSLGIVDVEIQKHLPRGQLEAERGSALSLSNFVSDRGRYIDTCVDTQTIIGRTPP